MAVDLDGKHDLEIQQKAKEFWDELGMRQKVDQEIAVVARGQGEALGMGGAKPSVT